MLRHLECGGRNHRFSKRLVPAGGLRFKTRGESERFEKRQLRLPQSKCRSPNIARIDAWGDQLVLATLDATAKLLRPRSLVNQLEGGHDRIDLHGSG